MRRVIFAFLCVCGVMAVDAKAATIYFDRSSFNLANPTATTIALDGLVGTPGYPENYPFGTGHWVAGPAGITVDGINVLGDQLSFAPETYLLSGDAAGGAYTLDGTYAFAAGRRTAQFTLPAHVSAFGSDFGLLAAAAGPLTMTAYFHDSSVESYVLSVTQRSQFVGISGGDIDRIVFSSTLPGVYPPFMLFDEVTYATTDVVATPEPTSVALLGTGLLALGFRCRRHTVSGHRHGKPTPAQEASTVTTAAVRFVARGWMSSRATA
jgi:hypothetical protein